MALNTEAAFTPTLAPDRLSAIAEHVRSTQFKSNHKRAQYIESQREVTTRDDFLAVSVLASSDPDAGIEPATLYGAENLADLVRRVMTAHIDAVATRALFRELTSESPHSAQISIPTTEPEATVEPNRSAPSRVGLDTTTVEAKHLTSSTVVEDPDYPPLGGAAQNLAYVFANQIEDTLDLENKEPVSNCLDAFAQLEEHNYHPDTIVSSDTITHPDIPGDEYDAVFGVPITVSNTVPGGYALVADSDHTGYEVEFDTMEVRTEDHITHNDGLDLDLRPMKVITGAHYNWALVEDNALAVVRL
jgi:hypothetical protein